MRLEKIQRQRVPSFGGVLNNKALLKGLEKVSEHGATFGATACLVGSLALRPLAIQATPKAKKENKQYASANSICSGLMKFAVAEAIVLPIENAVKKIDKNPEQFLKKETILNLKSTADNLIDSKTYKFATQIVKLGAGFLAAIPKSMLTVALIPLAVNTLFKPKTKKEEHSPQQVNFKGAIGNKIAKGVGKILDNEDIQYFASKNLSKDKNIAKQMNIATDLLLTGMFVRRTSKSEKINEERKKPLIYNSIISTGATAIFGSALDNAAKKCGTGLVEKFAKANANDPKLYKYIEGINIIRPTIIFALLYYAALPIISTWGAEKIDNLTNKRG